jgi:hypothetical protein
MNKKTIIGMIKITLGVIILGIGCAIVYETKIDWLAFPFAGVGAYLIAPTLSNALWDTEIY